MDSDQVQYEHGYKLGFVKDGKVKIEKKLAESLKVGDKVSIWIVCDKGFVKDGKVKIEKISIKFKSGWEKFQLNLSVISNFIMF